MVVALHHGAHERKRLVLYRINSLIFIACLIASSSAAQTARDALGAAAVESLENEPPAKVVVDPPVAEPLSRGVVVIQYRALNFHIAPVFGSETLAVTPRVGHVHVTLDDSPWVWADVSGEPVILVGLPTGQHKVRVQLENGLHQPLTEASVQFTVPAPKPKSDVAMPQPSEPPARIILGAPLADALSRGVVFINYRTEALRILPLFGPAALRISPQVGHIQVNVDDAPWHWASATGSPVVIQGLPPGPHKILIQLADATHRPLDQEVIQVTIPSSSSRPEQH